MLRALCVSLALIATQALGGQSKPQWFNDGADSKPDDDLGFVLVVLENVYQPIAPQIVVENSPQLKKGVRKGVLLDLLPSESRYGSATRVYAGFLPKGTYRVAAQVFDDPQNVWFLPDAHREFDVMPGVRTELLGLRAAAVMGVGATTLLLRSDSELPSESDLVWYAPELANHPTMKWPRRGWNQPLTDSERTALRAETERISALTPPVTETNDGALWLIAGARQLVERTPGGDWKVHQVPVNRPIASMHTAPQGGVLLTDDVGNYFLFRAGALTPFPRDGLPDDAVLQIDCDSRACVALVFHDGYRDIAPEKRKYIWDKLNAKHHVAALVFDKDLARWLEVVKTDVDRDDAMKREFSLARIRDGWAFEVNSNTLYVIPAKGASVQRDYPYRGRRLLPFGRRLIAFAVGAREAESSDQGVTWSNSELVVSELLTDLPVWAFDEKRAVRSRALPNSSYLDAPNDIARNQRFWRSDDGGANWNEPENVPNGEVWFSADGSRGLIVALRSFRYRPVVFFSTDGGVTWNQEIPQPTADAEGAR